MSGLNGLRNCASGPLRTILGLKFIFHYGIWLLEYCTFYLECDCLRK